MSGKAYNTVGCCGTIIVSDNYDISDLAVNFDYNILRSKFRIQSCFNRFFYSKHAHVRYTSTLKYREETGMSSERN